VATVQNAAKTASADPAGSAPREVGVVTAYTAALAHLVWALFDEADLSAEEAQASPDPRIQGTKPDPLRPRDPEAAASEGPQAPHSLDE